MYKTIEEKVNQLTDKQVVDELAHFGNLLDKMTLKTKSKLIEQITMRAYDYCSDRDMCKRLNVDYNSLPIYGYRKLLLYACYGIFDNYFEEIKTGDIK